MLDRTSIYKLMFRKLLRQRNHLNNLGNLFIFFTFWTLNNSEKNSHFMTRSFNPLDDVWLQHLAQSIRLGPEKGSAGELERLHASFDLMRCGEDALALAILQKQIAAKKYPEAFETGRWLLERATLSDEYRVVVLAQQAFLALQLENRPERMRSLLRLFALRPSYDLARRIIAASGTSMPGQSPFERVKDLYYQQISAEIPQRNVAIIDQSQLEDMRVFSARRELIDLSEIISLNSVHPFTEGLSAETELTALDVYAIPHALIQTNSVSYEIYDQKNNFIPELSSGDTPISGRPPLRPHRLAGRVAIVANYSMKGSGSAWFIDEMPTIIGILRSSPEPVAYWIFSESPTAMKIESLRKLGIVPEQIVALDQHRSIEAESLLAISGLASEARGSLRAEWRQHMEVLRTLILGHHHIFPTQPKRRIFLSPPEQDMREVIVGWEDLYERLNVEYNFERVHVGALTLDQRITLFSEAEAIVGFHGSAMLDLPLANPRTKVIEIMHPQIGSGVHAAFARMLGLSYVYLCGDNDVAFYHHHDAPYRAPIARPVVRLNDGHGDAIASYLSREIRRIAPDVSRERRTIVEVPRVTPHGMHICFYENIRVDQKPNALSFLASFVNHKGIERIIEIGTGGGGLTKVLLDHTPARVFTIDIEDRSPHLEQYSERLEKAVGDCFDPTVKDRMAKFKRGHRTLILCDGGNKPAEFNYFRDLLEIDDFIMVHDFAPTASAFQELLDSHFWLWHECSESQLNLAGLKHLDNFETIWKGFIWGAYRCVSLAAEKSPEDSTYSSKDLCRASTLTVADRFTREDLEWLRRLGAKLPSAGRYLDIDSGLGISAIAVASGIQEAGNGGAQVFCVDTWSDLAEDRQIVEAHSGSFFSHFTRAVEQSGVSHYIAPLQMGNAQAATLFSDGFFDAVFVGQRHTRAEYLELFDRWHPKCKPNRWISVFAGAENAELEGAIDDFASRRKLHVQLLREGSGNMWAIRFEALPGDVPSLD